MSAVRTGAASGTEEIGAAEWLLPTAIKYVHWTRPPIVIIAYSPPAHILLVSIFRLSFLDVAVFVPVRLVPVSKLHRIRHVPMLRKQPAQSRLPTQLRDSRMMAHPAQRVIGIWIRVVSLRFQMCIQTSDDLVQRARLVPRGVCVARSPRHLLQGGVLVFAVLFLSLARLCSLVRVSHPRTCGHLKVKTDSSASVHADLS